MRKLHINKILKGITFVLFTVLVSNCSPFDDPYLPIEGNIILGMYEQLDSTERKIYIILETERIYDCENYTLTYNTNVEDSVLSIELERIYAPEVCYTTRGPALATFNITDLADSIFKFNISMDNFTRSGYITKSSDEYVLTMDETAPLLITNKILKRVPEGVIWGIIEYDKPASDAYIDSFFMMLDTIGASQNMFADGSYNFFEVKDSVIVNPGSETRKLSQAFLMDLEGNFNAVAYWAQYVSYYSEDIRIRVSADKPYFYDTYSSN